MPDLQAMIQVALADAMRHTGIDAAELRVTTAEPVTWSDGSLGCPQPGMLYTQVLVPGYRIRIDAAGDTLNYHAGQRGSPHLCPTGRSREPVAVDSRI